MELEDSDWEDDGENEIDADGVAVRLADKDGESDPLTLEDEVKEEVPDVVFDTDRVLLVLNDVVPLGVIDELAVT